MENVTHLWNVHSFFTKFDDKRINKLRTHYIQCCRQLERIVDLPSNCFGSSVMCHQCGSLWTKVKHRNRLTPSKITKKALNLQENNGLSKFRSSLARKCLRGKMNKMTIKCFACSKYSEIPCHKPINKRNLNKSLNASNADIQQSAKKKKKRTKDKTAGLNISQSDSRHTLKTTPNKISTPVRKERKETGKVLTPLAKVKKLNKERLSNILNSSAKKRNSLSNFLKELY